MLISVFVYADWSARYPELSAWTSPQLAAMYFLEAGLYLDNTPTSPVSDIPTRTMLLYMLVAHIASINSPLNGQASSPLVGRISNATEGSVSVHTEMESFPGSANWFNSSKYGAAFWQATLSYRQARYIPAVPRNFQPYGFPRI